MKKIEKGTHGGVFDWLLESEGNACLPEGNSDMIRVLVQQHNELVDKIETIYQKGFEHGYANGKDDAEIIGKDREKDELPLPSKQCPFDQGICHEGTGCRYPHCAPKTNL